MSLKWSSNQIVLLIDTYKKEPCLYAINGQHYRNKHLRTAALNRVSIAVSKLRPTVTAKECATKFHNLRNQFNIEYSKVKSSLKSGTGIDDVYTPSLWYYEKLLFLQPYIIPRKNRTSFSRDVLQTDMSLSQGAATHIFDESSEDANYYDNIEYLKDDFVPELAEVDKAEENLDGTSVAKQLLGTDTTSLQKVRYLSPSPRSSGSSSLSPITVNNRQDVFPHRSISERSSSSTSGICSTSTRHRKKNPRLDSSNEYSDVIKSLTSTLKEPISISIPQTNSILDPVDGFLMFMGSLLRGFKDEELKLDVMNQVTQLIINAKTADYQQSKQ